jgi:coatomer protein complex subunit epsilon
MSESEELFTVRTYFWIGNYQGAINEANGMTKLKPPVIAEKDEWVYRCYIGLGQYGVVISEVNDSSSTPIGKRALRLLAAYYDNYEIKENVLSKLQDWLSDSSFNQNRTLRTVAATIFLNEDNHKESFKLLKDPTNLEHHAMLVELYLKMFRSDLAEKQLKVMKGIDEDAVLTMLASAQVNLSPNSTKIQDAIYIYEELIDKYGGTLFLLNGIAVAKMQMGLFEEAESALQDSLTKNTSDADTLANLIIVSHHLDRPQEVINRYMNQLRAKAPWHDLISSVDSFNQSFDRVAATLG